MQTATLRSRANSWDIEYFEGVVNGEDGFHVLRVMGDITRLEPLRAALDAFRTHYGLTKGPTVLHSASGEIGRWEPFSFASSRS